MKPSRLAFVVPVVIAATLTRCGDRSATGVGPSRVPLLPGLTVTPGDLLAHCANTTTGTVTQAIGTAGGVIGVGPDTLHIPPGALGQTVTIQASIVASSIGNVVAFQPNGLVFQKPVALSISYANCSVLSPLFLVVVQVDSSFQILQFLETTNDLTTLQVTGVVRHFSNYAVAW
ncbi:MAG TPA: hypothetical protein VM736_04480 [Gemmatimonadales bacterium]|nr:hypothetical protein [Gemmatimonadales bacterium]